MKKFLLALFISIPFLSFSQSLSLSNPHIEKEGDLYKAMITVTNSSGNSIEVRVKRTVETLANGHVTYFCWGNCYGPNTNESPIQDSRPIAAGASDANSFFGDVETGGTPGLTRVTYCFYDKKNPLDEVCYTFTYDVANGVQTVSISDAEILTSVYPNPVQSIGKVGYNLNGKKYTEANLVVRNLTGAIVKTYKIAQSNGEISINTDQMGNGIYMYSLIVDGKAMLTRKMTVSN